MTDIEWLARNVHEWRDDYEYIGFNRQYKRHEFFNMSFSACHERFTRGQWLAERARIQNKPSWDDAPDWAMWLAQSGAGNWFWFEITPAPVNGYDWDFKNKKYGLCSAGESLGDWRNTLERRPDDDTTPELDYGTKRGHNTTTPAPDFLSRALGHMNDRASTYDNEEGERSMGSTVDAFNSITGRDLTEEEGWLFMIMLKCARTQQGEFKSDNYEDGAAYFGLMGESASRDRA